MTQAPVIPTRYLHRPRANHFTVLAFASSRQDPNDAVSGGLNPDRPHRMPLRDEAELYSNG